MSFNTGLALASEPTMVVESDLLGPLSVTPEELIDFPTGLFGFPECQRFVLVPAPREGMFWLQSADHSPLVFLLVDPFQFFDGYSVELGAAELADLRATEPADVVILAIVTLPRSRSETPTANLQGPLALNLGERRARQLAISDSKFGVRCPVDLNRAPEAQA